MTVNELKKMIDKLPSDFEIAMLTANAVARPIEIEPVNRFAFEISPGKCGGFRDASRAFLLRPAKEIMS
jgi:hypothetical protein